MNFISHMKNMLGVFLWRCDFKHENVIQEFAKFSFFTMKSQHDEMSKVYSSV